MFSKFLSLEPERRNAILNAALKEFAGKGFDDASTNVIARESGISKPLMFHYVNNKKDFFLFLYDYCLDILNREYFDKIDVNEKDIFERLRQTCLLKIQVMQKSPWIFDFIKVAVFTDSEEVKDELGKKRRMVENRSFERFYRDIDTSKFRNELDTEKAKKLIFWAVGGYAGEILEQFRSTDAPVYDFEKIRAEFDSYLNELRKTYYK
ncbi:MULTISPECIES: TetR/AcrR family transcriptional regulator [Sedimentibacter]|uniref:TetR/AcrR family transcriptional regulator n=1 Tax=Sedimentibacter hydroxybenzoicus DSM 7310 TaxID=1123245 RepID=A0A974BLB2_SEDHY|nr:MULTISPECIES: TetR/AcrR family transcriptional regulator [Sedimentibacter]NYB75177.1 TetR/AcrR family transcriptional regulator [Sedimentibacter hydroxybenzoicus DSM 7310]